MAHYAFINDDNIVVEVITGIDENELIEGIEPEIWYSNFKNMKCKRTSYNGKIRGVYAGIGFSYNEEEDIFIYPQPYPSWIRNKSIWESPVAMPNDGKLYEWNEPNKAWELIND